MKKHLKSFLLALTAVILLMSSFACGGGKDYQTDELGRYYLDEDGNRVYELVMYDHGFVLPDVPEHREEVLAAINERLLKELGYKVDIQVLCFPDDQYDTKVTTDLAGEVVIDMLRIGSKETLTSYANQEMLMDLTDEVKDLDEMNEYLMAHNENIWMETTVNGKIYGIPSPTFTCYRGSWIRGDYLKKAGIVDENGNAKVPSTFAELETALEKMSEPGIMDGRVNVAWAVLLDELEGLILGNFTDTPGDFLDEDGNIMPKFFDPGYKAFIKKVHEWYKLGYVDDQLFNATYENVHALLRDGNTAIAGSNLWGLEWGSLRTIDEQNPEMDIRFLGYLDDSYKNSTTGFATDILIIPYTSINYKVMLQFFNWAMYNKENYSLVYNGLEGVTFEYEDNGSTRVPDAYKDDPNVTMPNNIFGKFLVGGNVEWNTEWSANESVPEQAIVAYQESLTMPAEKIYVPPTVYTQVKLDDMLQMEKGTADTNWKNSLQLLIKDSTLTDSEFDAKWAQMLEQYETDGGLKAYAEYTRVYKTLNFN